MEEKNKTGFAEAVSGTFTAEALKAGALVAGAGALHCTGKALKVVAKGALAAVGVVIGLGLMGIGITAKHG